MYTYDRLSDSKNRSSSTLSTEKMNSFTPTTLLIYKKYRNGSNCRAEAGGRAKAQAPAPRARRRQNQTEQTGK